MSKGVFQIIQHKQTIYKHIDCKANYKYTHEVYINTHEFDHKQNPKN